MILALQSANFVHCGQHHRHMRCRASRGDGDGCRRVIAGGRRVVARAIALGVGESSSLSVVQSSTRDGWITRDVNDPTKHRRRRHEGGGGGPASPARLRMFVRPSRFGLSIVLSFLLLDHHVVGRLRYHVGLLSYLLYLYKCFPTLRGVIPTYDLLFARSTANMQPYPSLGRKD